MVEDLDPWAKNTVVSYCDICPDRKCVLESFMNLQTAKISYLTIAFSISAER
jgi:hypothetical protein